MFLRRFRLGVPPCWRTYFLLLRQKKVAKEKATPSYAVGDADSPALLEAPGGCGTRGYAPQTVLADFPRHFSVARRSTRGPKGGVAHATREELACCGRLPKRGKNQNEQNAASARAVFPDPLRGAEQRRNAGGCRLALSEPQASLASRPAFRVAQGTGRSPAPTQGWLFLWLLSFCHQKESTPAPQARKPVFQKSEPPSKQHKQKERGPCELRPCLAGGKKLMRLFLPCH